MSFNTEKTLSESAMMGIVLEALHELVDYELAVVLGLEGNDILRVHTATGPLSGPRLSRFTLSLDKRPDLRQLLAEARPRLFREDEEHLDTYDEILEMPDGHSCLASPLVVSGEVIGLLTLDHRRCGVFSPEILRFIGVISRLIAIALVQAGNEAELQERAARLAEERNRLLTRDADVYRSFVGESPAWKSLKDLVTLVASAESPVLLLGETGTGKEEAARLIHRLSSRKDGPFVAVNCSALPASLAESELFGHEKGAFTGAHSLRKGRFELANGGTLFLDEIGDLPPEIQPKLLRVLQEGRFERVGGEQSVRVDVRVIAATHVDLARSVESGRFREDLFYRLSVFPIALPPLRERDDDAVLLAELFASRLRSRAGWESLSFASDALEAIAGRDWPGNVRELRNAVERAAILARGGEIRREHITKVGPRLHAPTGSSTGGMLAGGALAGGALTGGGMLAGGALAGGALTGGGMLAGGALAGGTPAGGGTAGDGRASGRLVDGTLSALLSESTERAIREALAVSGGKIYGNDGAAALLGMKPTTLQSKMKKLGISAR